MCGERALDWCASRFGWIGNDRHPLVQIFFLALVTGGLIIFMVEGWHRLPNPYASPIHLYLVPLLTASMYASFLIVSLSDPGKLDAKTAGKAIQEWPYDQILFESRICSTCLFDKPARSKHCPVCKCCVAKLDHHCVWVNNCIGHYNHRYFLLFLLTTTAYCLYGCYITMQLLRYEMQRKGMADWLVYDAQTGRPVKMSYWTQCIYIARYEASLSALSIFCAFAGAVLVVFMVAQFWTVCSGQTSKTSFSRLILANEKFKWEDLAYAIDKGTVTEIQSAVLKANKQGKGLGSNQDTFGLIARQNNKKLADMIPLKSITELRSIHDKGAWQNLLDVIFPRQL